LSDTVPMDRMCALLLGAPLLSEFAWWICALADRGSGRRAEKYAMGEDFKDRRIEERVRAIFRRWPALCGFTVQHSSGLFIGDVTLNPPGSWSPSGALMDEIAAVLAELMEEFPDAGELLRKRTFARAFH
jgi:hypothetical protein